LSKPDNSPVASSDNFLAFFNSLDEGCALLHLIYDAKKRPVDFQHLEINPAEEKMVTRKGAGPRTIDAAVEQSWLYILDRVASTGSPERIEKYSEDLKRWFSFRLSRVGGPGSNFIAVIFDDVTSRKNAEEALRTSEVRLQQANNRLQEMNKAKTDFFNNISHEFRTPLALLMGPLGDIVNANKLNLSPEEFHKLELSYRGATRLQKLVNTLLDFATIEAGKIEAFYQPTDITRLTVDLASHFRSAIEAAGLKFVVKAETISEPIYLNREMWEKIVFNLISNALKFTHKGKIQIVVHEKNRSVEFRVKDTGVGISAKNADRIFERFVRIEGNKGRVYEGSGIGLALVRELVWAHKGNIKVRSEEGDGAEFIVTIPKGKNHLDPKQVYENKKQLPAALISDMFVEEATGWLPEDQKTRKKKEKEFDQHNGTRILIADDNADMREYLVSILSDKYKVLAVEHGRKVIDFLEKGGQADLIISDVMMPEMNGYEVVDFMKSNSKYRNIPVILLSARTTEQAKIEGLNVGADDYLTKPFSVAELRALVNSRMKRSNDFPIL
jgi:signal transduction histidine kinase/CheY-like chemotaxis protein